MREWLDPNREDAHSEVVHRGSFGSVEFARMPDGEMPAMGFWISLSTEQQAKFMAQFRAIVNTRELQLRNRQQFKQVDGRLFEFKRNDIQSRIFAFRHGSRWLLVHGMTGKKEDRLPKGEVERAKRLMNDAMRSLGVG